MVSKYLKWLISLLILLFSLISPLPAKAYFAGSSLTSQNSFSAGDWTGSTSSATDNLDIYQTTSNFSLNFTAQDSISQVSLVSLYYRHSNGDWTLFETKSGLNSQSVSGSFDFTSPQGDGFYEFITVSEDIYSNKEDEDENDTPDVDELDFLTPDTATTVDTHPVVSAISTDFYTAVANELIYNGGFENGNLDGWTIDSTGSDHQATSEDTNSGNYSALIGFKTANPSVQPAYDSLKQSISLPSWITSTLSFWYRLMTLDINSGGFFDVSVKYDSEEIKIAHNGWDDPLITDADLGWKNVTYQLNNLEGKNIDVQFKVTQPDENYKTWAYLDDIKVCAAENKITTASQIEFTSHDSSGSGSVSTRYKIDSGSFTDYTLPITLSAGSHTVSYYSLDDAGNSEDAKQININVQENPVEFGIVLNEFLPDPVGNDNASKPNGEWVKFYNHSGDPIDVAGWVLYDALDTHPLVISSSNSDNNANLSDAGETIVPSAGILTVYLDGAYSPGWLNNNAGDTIRLYNAAINAGGVLIDSFTYKINAVENKSFKRQPDGIGGWMDPVAEAATSSAVILESSIATKSSVVRVNLTFQSDNPVESSSSAIINSNPTLESNNRVGPSQADNPVQESNTLMVKEEGPAFLSDNQATKSGTLTVRDLASAPGILDMEKEESQVQTEEKAPDKKEESEEKKESEEIIDLNENKSATDSSEIKNENN